MTYTAKDYAGLVGMPGFSETLLKNHFTLYQGYVTNTNKVLETLDQMLKEGKTAVPEFAELKRRLGWEFNGMRLHELYFENLTPHVPELGKDSVLHERLSSAFGRFESWRRDFVTVARMRGVGWAVLYEDPETGRLSNHWITLHEHGHPAGFRPLLVMDVWEHAFMVDYRPTERAKYIDAFFINVDWAVVERRFRPREAADERTAVQR